MSLCQKCLAATIIAGLGMPQLHYLAVLLYRPNVKEDVTVVPSNADTIC